MAIKFNNNENPLQIKVKLNNIDYDVNKVIYIENNVSVVAWLKPMDFPISIDNWEGVEELSWVRKSDENFTNTDETQTKATPKYEYSGSASSNVTLKCFFQDDITITLKTKDG